MTVWQDVAILKLLGREVSTDEEERRPDPPIKEGDVLEVGQT